MNDPGNCGRERSASRPRCEDTLALYFFDIHDDRRIRVDDVGVELETHEQARSQARQSLSDIASDEIVEGGERRSFLILVRNEHNQPIYTASLNYTGLWLGP